VTFLERLGALGWFLLAAAWFLFSDVIAQRAASGLTYGDFYEPLYRIFMLFLLVCGYSLMSRLSLKQSRPGKNIGLDARKGWGGEFGLGAAMGWAGVVACVLPAALIGGLVITVFGNGHQVWVALIDGIALLVGTLAIEVAFRGYAFRRLVDAMGPVMATFFMAATYAIWRTHGGPTSTAAVVVSFLLGCVLGAAALRTAAVWVGWGFHFAWIAVMSLVFGLPVAGGMNYSPVFVTNASGPGWVTGNGQGPEGSAFGVIVTFALLIAMFFTTDDLHYRHGIPEIVPGGIPMDLDSGARRPHEAAIAHTESAAPQLVQILRAAGTSERESPIRLVDPMREADSPMEERLGSEDPGSDAIAPAKDQTVSADDDPRRPEAS
jgi:uncharacterized protein